MVYLNVCNGERATIVHLRVVASFKSILQDRRKANHITTAHSEASGGGGEIPSAKIKPRPRTKEPQIKRQYHIYNEYHQQQVPRLPQGFQKSEDR